MAYNIAVITGFASACIGMANAPDASETIGFASSSSDNLNITPSSGMANAPDASENGGYKSILSDATTPAFGGIATTPAFGGIATTPEAGGIAATPIGTALSVVILEDAAAWSTGAAKPAETKHATNNNPARIPSNFFIFVHLIRTSKFCTYYLDVLV